MQPKKYNLSLLFNQTVVVLAITVLVGVLFFLFSYNALTNLVKGMLDGVSDQCVIAIENYFESNIKLAQTIANVKELRDTDISIEQSFNEIEPLVKFNHFERVLLIDMLGNAVSNYGEELNVKDNSYFVQASNGKSIVSEPIYSSFDGDWISTVSTPIYDKDGHVNGVVAFSMPAESLVGLVKGASLVPGGMSFIVDREGMVKVAAIEIMRDDLTHQPITDFIQTAVREEEGYGEYAYNGIDFFAVFQPIPDTDWILVTNAPRHALFKNVKGILVCMAVLLCFVIVVVTVLYTHLMSLSKSLREERKRSSVAVRTAKIITIQIRKDGSLIDGNENFYDELGYSKKEIEAMNISDILAESGDEAGEFNIQELFHTTENELAFQEFDMPVKKKNGELSYILWNVIVSGSMNKSGIVELVGTNITKLKEYQKKIHRLAYYDTLTDLGNKTRLEVFVTDYIQKGIAMALLYVDFDNFKFINDSFGHAAGDEFIVEICHRLVSLNISNSRVFRIGGDEVAIVYTGYYDYGEIGDFGNFIANTVSGDVSIENAKISTSCSIGISVFPNDGKSYSELYRAADIAMNKAKQMGKARITFFNASMNEELVKAILLEMDLKEAVRKEEFVLYYQPQYDMETGRIYGYEALIRWLSPTRGFVSPVDFVPAVEKNLLVIPMGSWALKEAAKFALDVVNRGHKDICIAVNVSVAQISDENFVGTVLSILNESGVGFQNIKLELTESVMMESIDINLLKINELRSHGIQFALDDFGTGYSSLTYLQKLPIETLKIDKSFVDTILEDGDDRGIISTMIGLSHNLGLKVVAEGVEEKGQLDWLREQGCNICQGYYSGRPAASEEALVYLDRNLYELS